jgi:hypothetical protein
MHALRIVIHVAAVFAHFYSQPYLQPYHFSLASIIIAS